MAFEKTVSVLDTDLLRCTLNGAILRVEINNPPYNMIVSQVMTELDSVLDFVDAHREVRSVVLGSAVENIFLTHYEVEEILELGDRIPFYIPPGLAGFFLAYERSMSYIPFARRLFMSSAYTRGLSALNLYHQVCARIRSSSAVWIAEINGRGFGGGCELALSCDFRVMADGPLEEGFALGQPEICIGVTPGGGGTQMLARCVGNAKALEICLEARPVTAKEAFELGLVTKIVPPAELHDATLELAQRMARRSPVAVKAIKTCIHQGSSLSIDDGMKTEQAQFAACASYPPHQPAMRKYLAEKDKLHGDAEIEPMMRWVRGEAYDLGKA